MTKFFSSDHHFFHTNILNFKRSDGNPLRSFKNIEHMNEEIVRRHNEVVQPGDTCYFLGDVCMGNRMENLPILKRLQGTLILVPGNHDSASYNVYLNYFKDVKAYIEIGKDLILSHMPIHSDSVGRFSKNLHGHTHSGYVNDSRYLCASLEHLNYTPISLDEVKSRLDRNQKHFDRTGFVIDFSDPDRIS